MICEGWSWSGLAWSFAEYINWWPVSSEKVRMILQQKSFIYNIFCCCCTEPVKTFMFGFVLKYSKALLSTWRLSCWATPPTGGLQCQCITSIHSSGACGLQSKYEYDEWICSNSFLWCRSAELRILLLKVSSKDLLYISIWQEPSLSALLEQ